MNLSELFLLKSKSGVYKDNSENRRLHRVGQRYGGKKPEVIRPILPSEETLKQWGTRRKSLGAAYKIISSIEEYEGSPARSALRENLIQNVVKKAVRHFDKPKAVFCLGGAASGKSSSLKALNFDESVIPCQLNPDNFQEGVLQKDNMFYNWTRERSGSSRLHRETSLMTKEAYRRVLATGGDFVKDGVMSDYDEALKNIQAAIDAGYEPEIVGVSLSTKEASKRNKARYLRAEEKEKYSGRWVPRKTLEKGHAGAAATFARLMMEHPEFKLKLFDNNVEFGEKPVLIYDSSQKPSVLDRGKVLRFFKKNLATFKTVKNYIEMKKDFAKSILDNPYNRVEGGEKIDLFDILLKYCYQHQHEQMANYDAWAEDLGITEEEALKYQAWINDGKPTGIESDKQFYDLQKRAYGEVTLELDELL